MGNALTDPGNSSIWQLGNLLMSKDPAGNLLKAREAERSKQTLEGGALDLLTKKSRMQALADQGLGVDPNTGITWNGPRDGGPAGASSMQVKDADMPDDLKGLPRMPLDDGYSRLMIPQPPAATAPGAPPTMGMGGIPLPPSVKKSGNAPAQMFSNIPDDMRGLVRAGIVDPTQLLMPDMVNIVGHDGKPAGQVPKWQLSRLPPGYLQAAPVRTEDTRGLKAKTAPVVIKGPNGLPLTVLRRFNPDSGNYDLPLDEAGVPAYKPGSELGNIKQDELMFGGGSAIPRPPANIITGGAPGQGVIPAPVAGPGNPFAPGSFGAAAKKATQTPAEAALEKGGADDVIDYAKTIEDEARQADATLPDLQQLQASRRIFLKTGTFGEQQAAVLGAAQNLGLGGLVDKFTNSPEGSTDKQAAAAQIIEKMTTAGGFANKPEAIQRLTQQEVQNLSRIFPGAINQSDDAANIMMGLKIAQLQQKQKMRNALTGMRDKSSGAPPIDLRGRMLPFTLEGNKEAGDLITKLTGQTFGSAALPKGWALGPKDAQGRQTATDPQGKPHVWVPD